MLSFQLQRMPVGEVEGVLSDIAESLVSFAFVMVRRIIYRSFALFPTLTKACRSRWRGCREALWSPSCPLPWLGSEGFVINHGALSSTLNKSCRRRRGGCRRHPGVLGVLGFECVQKDQLLRASLLMEMEEKMDRRLGLTPRFSQLIQESLAVRSAWGETAC